MKKLPKEFVDSYADEVPPWGPVGYITYKRTYARLIEKTGKTEEWHEHCARLVNGLLELGAPYTEDEAYELFDVLFYMKGSVSGRAHWQLGTQTVLDIGADSLQNCFSGETEFITSNGVRRLDECVGQVVLVLTRDGWQLGVVSSFGEQQLLEVTTNRNSYFATANHEWIVDGQRVCTKDLEGQRLPLNPQGPAELSRRGQAHGFVFGDGHVYNKRFTAAYLFGEKECLYDLLGDYGVKSKWGADLVVHSMPPTWKEVPDTDCRSYACGFLSGLIAADGNVRGNSVRINNKSAAVLEKVKRLAQLVGFRAGDVYLDREFNPFDGSYAPCYCVSLNAYTELPDGFFIREGQRKAFGSRRFDLTEKVKAVTPTDRFETVYCVSVPGLHEFTLANGTLTGNCWHVACRDMESFCFTFDELMLGGGVGYNIQAEHVYELPRVQSKPKIQHVDSSDCDFIVPDNREGWVEALRLMLKAYTKTGRSLRYSTRCIRPAGARINGFGGVASGANALVKGLGQISKVMDGAYRRKLKPIECLDIMNIIGSVVVSGNVRRCLPGDSSVFTRGGQVNIRDINVCDEVLTAKGYCRVTNKFVQGEQPLVETKTENGVFECTANHRMAVMDGVGSYSWKPADELVYGDRLVGNREAIEGSDTSLPEYQYVKPPYSTTCKDITTPSLDERMAWFIGLFHGDGYVDYKKDRTSGSNTIMVVFPLDQAEAARECKRQIERFGVNARLHKRKGENAYQVTCTSRQLAEYIHTHIKRPKTSINIPDFITKSRLSIRVSYLRGLLDSDGSVKTKPFCLCVTIYEEFAEAVRLLAASCGIQVRVKGRVRESWQDIYYCSLLSHTCKTILFSGFGFKYVEPNLKERHASSYPSEWVLSDDRFRGYKSSIGAYSNRQCTMATVERCVGAQTLVPVKVIGVSPGRVAETYDIEVEGRHEFFCEGLLTHNSAQIALGDYNDSEYLAAKNWGSGKVPAWRAMSNNSIITSSVAELPDQFWGGYDGTGEPYGLVNLDACRKYGRLADGEDYRPDHGVLGVNPCAEITLEDREACNLAEVYLPNIKTLKEFKEVTKLLYIACKTISRVPFSNALSEEVSQRNHRIGIGLTGWMAAPKWRNADKLNAVYKYLEKCDKHYSKIMGLNTSIKLSTIKPSGTLSLLPDNCPSGVHAAFGRHLIRRIRFAANDPLVDVCIAHGYHVEPLQQLDGTTAHDTLVVSFPLSYGPNTICEEDCTVYDQLHQQQFLQTYWADNSVSATHYFRNHELEGIKDWLAMNYTNGVKTASFLLADDHGFAQAPLEKISEDEYNKLVSNTRRITSVDDSGGFEIGGTECAGGACPVK